MNREMLEAMYKLRDELGASDPDLTTVSVTRSNLVALLKEVFFLGDEWSNQAALGYAISAAERVDMSSDEIEKMVGAMREEFDLQTLDSAAAVYRESDY